MDCFQGSHQDKNQRPDQDTKATTVRGVSIPFSSENDAKATTTADQELTHDITATHTPKVSIKVRGQVNTAEHGTIKNITTDTNSRKTTHPSNNTRRQYGGATMSASTFPSTISLGGRAASSFRVFVSTPIIYQSPVAYVLHIPCQKKEYISSFHRWNQE